MGFLKNCKKSAYYHPPSVACVSQRCGSCQVLNGCSHREAVVTVLSIQEWHQWKLKHPLIRDYLVKRVRLLQL